jgi:hypothetical protein
MFVFATLVTREDGAVLGGVDEMMFPPRRSLVAAWTLDGHANRRSV